MVVLRGLTLVSVLVLVACDPFSSSKSVRRSPFSALRRYDSSTCLPWQQFDAEVVCNDPSCAPSDLDYYDFVARKTGQLVESPGRTTTNAPEERPADIVREPTSPSPVLQKETTERPKQKSPVVVPSPAREEFEWSDLVSWLDIPSLFAVLFPDPFQAYVFAGLLCWLVIVLLLLAREWRKSSRIVLDVYLHHGTETNPLIEDRLKDQLNLPGEYSLLG